MKAKIYILSLLAVFFSSCDDYFSGMDIENEYEPNIGLVMQDASPFPSLLSGICNTYWSQMLGYGDSAHWLFASTSDQLAPGAGNWDFKVYLYYAGVDKPEINNSNESASFPNEDWNSFYSMLNTLKDMQKGINEGAVYMEDGEDATYKLLANINFLMGTVYTEMALLFDQCFVIGADTDVATITGEDLVSAATVQQTALSYLDECIKICNEKGDFDNLANAVTLFPNGTIATGNKLKQMANFMAARCLAYFPRTNTETVDWNKVLTYAKDGIQEDIITTLPYSGYPSWTVTGQSHKNGGWARVGMRILEMMCPDEPNAVWPLPLDFGGSTTLAEFKSPDARLKTDFEYVPDNKSAAGVTFSGYTNYSPYTLNRFNEYVPNNGSGNLFLYTKSESDLLYAEALVNTSSAADAANIINETRVGRGELAPVSAATPKEDLLEALYYERFVECGFVNPLTPFYDRRRTPIDEFQLATRSFRELPVPYYELKTYGLESYTFGGAKDEYPQYKF